MSKGFQRGLLLAVLSLSLTSAVAAQLHPVSPQDFRYDIVSIKPSGNTVPWWGDDEHPDGITIRNLTLSAMIVDAYDLLDSASAQVVFGGDKWVSTQKFDIDAKLDPEHIAAFAALDKKQREQARHLMLQALLAEHFHLRAHRESRELPVYSLVISKSGSRLTAHEKNADGHDAAPGLNMGAGFLNGTAAPASDIVLGLNNRFIELDRPVVDHTGLAGRYDFHLHWAALGHENSSDPSLFTALEEQLGLRLEKNKAPMDVVVVESAATPQLN